MLKRNSFVLALLILTLIPYSIRADQPTSIKPAPVRFVILGDRTGGHTPGIYGQIVEEASRLRPDFVVTVGDAIEGYTEDTTVLKERWEEYISLIEPLTCPVYHTPGNHDAQGAASEALYRRYLGPLYYSFKQGNLHFIVLDNSRWDRSDELPEEQIRWLTAELETVSDTAVTFVFIHKPFWYNSTALGQADTLHSLFVTYGVDAVVTGHYHSYFSGEYDGIQYTCIGSSGGSFSDNRPGPGYHFAWVTVDDHNISIAPITIGSVLPWDIVSPAELALVSKMEHEAIIFSNYAPVSDDLTIPFCEVTLSVHNLTETFVWDDTLRWETVPGWTVDPVNQALNIEPGATSQVSFKVESIGPLYPLPRISLKVPHTDTDSCLLTKNLRVARRILCKRAASPVLIDGILNEECWSEPVSSLFGNDAQPSTNDSTFFYFAYDSDNLYLAVRCLESDIGSLVASVVERDGAVYGDDCAGFFIQPDLNKRLAYQVYVNTLETIFDQRLWAKEDGYFTSEVNWNASYEIVARTDDRSWQVEVNIPLAEINATVESGSEWGVNFRRKQQRTSSAAHFQTPWSYNTETYGRLVFE